MLVSFESPPALSAAYAPEPVAWMQVPRDGSVHASSIVDGAADMGTFQRRHQRGKAGVIVMAASAGAVVVGTIAFAAGSVAALDGSNPGSGAAVGLAGFGLLGLGAVGFVVGEVLMFEGGIGASKIAGIDTTVGWVGVGLLIAGIPAGILLPQLSPALGYVTPVFGLAGMACGAVQLGMAGKAGRERQWAWHVTPTLNGIGVAGSF